MSTRCTIEVNGYKIYRHSDGYPDGVLSDIRMACQVFPLDDPEYFLANFIFLAKWNFLQQGDRWASGYGVCSLVCTHGDIEYEYKIYNQRSVWMVEVRKISLRITETIFKGALDDAYKHFIKNFEEGCHIKELP